jgi:Leucine-rich repeat (LRR) protein
VFINAPNIVSLDLLQNNFEKVCKDRFIIPPGIKHLNLALSSIAEIAKDEDIFPNGLELLDLTHNSLRRITGLPSSLKKLDVGSNPCYSDNAVFPTGLESLDVSDCLHDNAWLQNLNLASTNIKDLDITGNQFSTLDLGTLPRTLVKLTASDAEISEIVGDFREFTKLEKLFLDQNPLRKHFRDATRKRDTLFGDSIRHLDLELVDLQMRDVRTM